MYYYTAYGLSIKSFFELSELRPSEEVAETDIVVERGDVAEVPESVDGKWIRRIQASPDQCRVTYESYGTFLIRNGTHVLFDPDSNDVVEKRETRHLLQTQIFGLLLHQRGRLVLHASAASINGKAAIFLGPSGAGKSTMAAAIGTEGYTVLEDDVVSVRIEGGTPVVDPGVPKLRLSQQITGPLDLDSKQLLADHLNENKKFMNVDGETESVPLKRCYILQTGTELGIEKVDAKEGLLHLISNTYVQGFLPEMGSQADHLHQTSNVVERVPFRILTRPDDLGRVRESAYLVIDDIM